MPEQNYSPHPVNPQDSIGLPMPPSHLISNEKWAPPKRPEALDSRVLDDSNPTYIIDTSRDTNIDTSTIGMEGELPKGWSLEVTGFIGIGGNIAENGEPEYKIPIIKESKNGNDRFTIIGVGKTGKPKAVHTFSFGESVHLGRKTGNSVDRSKSEIGIDLDELGIDSGDMQSVSRDHVTLTWTGSGIEVTDHSTFKTKVEAIEKKDKTGVKQVGGAVTSLSGGSIEEVEQPQPRKLIDSSTIPKSPEDFARLEAERAEEINRPVLDQLAEVEEEFDAFRGQYTDDQTLNMWKYAAGLMNKREAQIRGDGQASYDHERLAGEGLNALRTQELKSAADKYHGYMLKISSLRKKLI